MIIEAEYGRAEILLPLLQDIGSGRAVVGRRRVIEGGHFGEKEVVFLERSLVLDELGEVPTPLKEMFFLRNPSDDEPLHLYWAPLSPLFLRKRNRYPRMGERVVLRERDWRR